MVSIEIIAGPMFSGKSEELIRRARKALYADKKVLIVKPPADTRDNDKIICYKKNLKTGEFEVSDWMPADIVYSEEEFRNLITKRKPDMIIIDEAQFFDEWLLGFMNSLSNFFSSFDRSHAETNGEFVILIGGLDLDAWRRPFGIVPRLMAMADYVQKEPAVCFKCKGKYGPAIFTQKIGGSSEQVEVGKADIYEARCRACHRPPPEN